MRRGGGGGGGGSAKVAPPLFSSVSHPSEGHDTVGMEPLQPLVSTPWEEKGAGDGVGGEGGGAGEATDV